jgi:hypothetical protein
LKYSRIRTAWQALESWEPAKRAAAREIACQQPAESTPDDDGIEFPVDDRVPGAGRSSKARA